jgi:hypothetical protein
MPQLVPVGLVAGDISEPVRQQHPLVQKIQEIQQATSGMADSGVTVPAPAVESADMGHQHQAPFHPEVASSSDVSAPYTLQVRSV